MDVFKSLLKSANVGSDWTWEQVVQLSLLAVLCSLNMSLKFQMVSATGHERNN